MAVTEDATAIAGELTHLRRAIHAEPEIGLNLPLTRQKSLAALDGLPLEITLGAELSSVTAVLRGGSPGPIVLLRGDMDALPVPRRAACVRLPDRRGDARLRPRPAFTALVGAARLLRTRRSLAGGVVFMFQPGEEGTAAPSS